MNEYLNPLGEENEHGVYVLKTVFPDGMERTKETNLSVGQITIEDLYPNVAYRQLHQWIDPQPGSEEESTEEFKKHLTAFRGLMQRGTTGFIAFYDEQVQTKQAIIFPTDISRIINEDHIKVLNTKEDNAMEPDLDRPIDYLSLVTLTYQRNKDVSCVLQAHEATNTFQFERGHESQNLEEAVPVFLNYLRDYFSSVETPNNNTIRSAADPKLNELANQLQDEVLDMVPIDDQPEVKQLLNNFRWPSHVVFFFHTLTNEGIKNIDEVISRYGRSRFLLDLINREIVYVQMELSRKYQTVLEVDDFTNDSFHFTEVEIDARTLSSSQRGERIERNSGRSGYGKELVVQDNTFLVDKFYNQISVDCKSRRGLLWNTSFHLEIPYQEIVENYEDEYDDFRKIKDLLGITFQVG